MSSTPQPVSAIHVRDLRKTYTTSEREAGLLAAFRSVVRRRTRQVMAVGGISFDVAPGEIVGFLGPNGAGKTTTLKMLSGLLYPTAGEVRVLGHVPWRREKDYLRQITLVMGNRQQLTWDIPVIDSLLDLEPLLRKPVRSLSLGERMKCEVAAALLHTPRVLFLDEPTLGLDVTMQRRIRAFVAEYNRRHAATVLLTSHYMADVEALCRRVIVIHHGVMLIDGDLTSLVQRFSPHKTITVEVEDARADLSAYGEVATAVDGQVTLRVPKAATPYVTARLLAELPVVDLTVEDPPIEDVIEHVFAQEAVGEAL